MATTLYRAYRPQNFTDVIGQDHVVAVLSAAITKNSVAHAYLFTGARGTGKTTVGRLLAKALNCENPQTDQPICETCATCVSITNGSNLDVVEIDAASNRGIDDIRLLKEQVQFPPQSVRRKVYIIDEVHMLTMEAFNALLKTLEEPPAHVVFILATTEIHKVPITIQSRCQRLDFHRGTVDAIQHNLQRVVAAEKLQITADALALIAELSEGGFRDSLTLLERVTQLDGEVTADVVRLQLGLGDESLARQLITALVGGDRAGAFQLLDDAYTKGANPPSIAQLIVMAVRRLLYISAGALETADSTEADLAARLSLGAWRELLEDWTEAIIESRRSPLPPLALEIAAAKWLERGTPVSAGPSSVQPTPTVTPPPISAPKPVVAESAKPADSAASTMTVEPTTVAPVKTVTVADGRNLTADEWTKVVEQIVAFNHSLSKLLLSARCSTITNGSIDIAVPYQFHVDTLQQKANTNAVALALEAVIGVAIIPRFVVVGATPTTASDSSAIDTIHEVFLGK